MRNIEFTKKNGASQKIIDVMNAFEVKTIGEYIDKGGVKALQKSGIRNCGAGTIIKIMEFIEGCI
jgi:hypothetical protein